MLPLPGGMGISETLFLKIFPPVFGSTLLLPAMVLSRGLGYYGELLVSAVFTIVAQLTIGKYEKRKKMGELHMIGFYDYTVILTYISFASSISGIFLQRGTL